MLQDQSQNTGLASKKSSREFPLKLTREIPKPTYYVKALNGEFSDWALNEERAISYKGLWRSEIFKVNNEHPLDVEVGTGNGFFFAHQAQLAPERCLLGIELKYKPLIQSIRRALNQGSKNARICRYHANYLWHLFEPGEINNVYIHHPDPWLKKRWNKNRLIQTETLDQLFEMQRPGSFLEFKTDSRDYMDWALERFKNSKYRIEFESFDLHNSDWAEKNFVTHFESIFIKQGVKINYCYMIRE